MTLRFEPDVSHADWWATRDEPWEVLATVGPSGFPAYAQVLAPMAEDDAWILLLEAREGWNWDDQVLAAVDALVADPRVRALPVAWGPLTDPRGEPT